MVQLGKSKVERMHSAHGAFVKRVVGSLDQSKLAQLEVEWNQGSVWTYSNLVASSAVPVPPGSNVQDLFVREELDNKPWVDVAKLSGDLKLDARRVRSALAEVN